MKIFNKSIIAVLLTAAALTGCGNSKGIPAEIPENSSKAEFSAVQEAETEADTVAETTEATTTTSAPAETTVVTTTMPKVNEYTEKYIDDWNEEVEKTYYFVPQEATVLSDDINLGLITVDGKEFDIIELSDAYKNEASILKEQAGLYTDRALIANGVFEDVHINECGFPENKRFLFGETMFFRRNTNIDVFEELYGLEKSRGIYDFITAEYVNGWFKGLYTKCFAINSSRSNVEQITVNGEVKPFVEEDEHGSLQITENKDKLITYTDKNIAVGDGTTYSDLVAMFGAEPTYVDYEVSDHDIYAYRNSTVTVGFVIDDLKKSIWYNEVNDDWSEEKRNNAPVIALYMWLND